MGVLCRQIWEMTIFMWAGFGGGVVMDDRWKVLGYKVVSYLV